MSQQHLHRDRSLTSDEAVGSRDEADVNPWRVTGEAVREYLQAVGDESPLYAETGLVPPVALAAYALGNMLEELSIPPGAIHSRQEVETLEPVGIGQDLVTSVRVSRRARRRGLEFMTAGYAIQNDRHEDLSMGQSTILVPGLSSIPVPIQEDPPVNSRMGESNHGESCLPSLVKVINQEQLNSYARVSGDHNPLHLDSMFAASTQFGGIIAHGMLTLAFIGEMMVRAFGRDWLESGSLKARFKGAAHLGEVVETWGSVSKEESHAQGRGIHLVVGLVSKVTGQELITGSATVKI